MAIRLTTGILFVSTFFLLPLPSTFAKDIAPDAGSSTSASNNAANISELQALMKQTHLLELRSTFNGSYGASLLLNRETQTYYVASFQHKTFFRVFKNRSEENAENHYRKLSDWTEARAKEEIAGIKKAAKQYQNARFGEKSAALDERGAN